MPTDKDGLMSLVPRMAQEHYGYISELRDLLMCNGERVQSG